MALGTAAVRPIQPAWATGRRRDCAKRVSIVMPCLNEEETVGVCVDEGAWAGWQRRGIPARCSSSTTARRTDRRRSPTAAGARVIHERRRGYGQAYLRGFAEARGDYIVMGDSDDTYDFSDLDALIAPLERRRRHGARQPVRRRDRAGRDAVGASLHRQPDHQLPSSGSSSAPGSATARAACARSGAASPSGSACGPAGWSSPPR